MSQASSRPRPGWLPHPVMSALLIAAWLLLQQSFAVPQVLTALLLGWGLPLLVRGFLGPGTRMRAWVTGLRLACVVLRDIVVANMQVARLVLWPWAQARPAWVRVPLALENPTAISLLATIITTTPGTVSCVIDEARGEILVHALDCADPEAVAADIKARYEAPLKEMLG